MHRLLIIDDDKELCALLTEYLEPEGFIIHAIHNGVEAAAECTTHHYDIILLDVMLPKLNGFDVLRNIREISDTPVIMLTARGEEIDRIVGIEMGADDYLPKPCSPRELLARIRGVLRRTIKQMHPVNHAVELSQGDVVLNKLTRSVSCKDELLELTAAEFNILEILLMHVGQVVSKADLTGQALRRDMTKFDRSIDVHISKLRRKLGKNKQGYDRIRTIRAIGYVYEEDENA